MELCAQQLPAGKQKVGRPGCRCRGRGNKRGQVWWSMAPGGSFRKSPAQGSSIASQTSQYSGKMRQQPHCDNIWRIAGLPCAVSTGGPRILPSCAYLSLSAVSDGKRLARRNHVLLRFSRSEAKRQYDAQAEASMRSRVAAERVGGAIAAGDASSLVGFEPRPVTLSFEERRSYTTTGAQRERERSGQPATTIRSVVFIFRSSR